MDNHFLNNGTNLTTNDVIMELDVIRNYRIGVLVVMFVFVGLGVVGNFAMFAVAYTNETMKTINNR